MIKQTFCLLVAVAVFAAWGTPAAAQGTRSGAGCGAGGWGREGPYFRHFDASKMETLSGEVVSVQ